MSTPDRPCRCGAARLLYEAWVVIANAYGGNWSQAEPDWQKAARRWRADWHNASGAR